MYLAMEYMRGGDLEANLLDLESLTENGPAIPEEDIKEITSQILEGLKIMHAEGFAHRDFKPKVEYVCVAHIGLAI
jgi:serine/threonine protein kinase